LSSSLALLESMTTPSSTEKECIFSQCDWGGYTSMRFLTTNGMDVKEMKGHTNPSKWDVLRCPPELTGF
jgi:hypothetical protein